jgi:hypothetical protein
MCGAWNSTMSMAEASSIVAYVIWLDDTVGSISRRRQKSRSAKYDVQTAMRVGIGNRNVQRGTPVDDGQAALRRVGGLTVHAL